MKFKEALVQTSKEIRAQRAGIITANAKDAAEELLRHLQKQLRDIESRMLELTDVSRDSELSLKVVKNDFNPKDWFSELLNLKEKQALKKIEVEMAEELFDEWFGDSEEKEEEVKVAKKKPKA